MESLAAVVTAMLLVIYGSAFTAFALSWSRKTPLRVATTVLASVAISTGVWLVASLIEGNGVIVGGIPVAVGLLSLINSYRRNR